MYWHENNLFGSAVLQKLSLGEFKWIIKNKSKINEDFIKEQD